MGGAAGNGERAAKLRFVFMSAEMAGVSIDAVIREVTALLIILLAVLVLSTYWPTMVMAIPNFFQSAR